MPRKATGNPNGRPYGSFGKSDPWVLHKETLAIVLDSVLVGLGSSNLSKKKIAALAERLAEPSAGGEIDSTNGRFSLDALHSRATRVANIEKSLAAKIGSERRKYLGSDADWVKQSSFLLLHFFIDAGSPRGASILLAKMGWPVKTIHKLIAFRAILRARLDPNVDKDALEAVAQLAVGEGLISWPRPPQR